MRRSSGIVSLIRSSPPVTPASAMKLPISMWSGATVCSQPPRRSAPWTVSTFEPIPWIVAPILTSMRARSWTCGSQAALRITVVARRQRGRHQRVLGRHHRRLVHQDVAGAQAARRGAARCRGRARSCGAERPEGVEVRVEAAAADHVAARRRHLRAAEARQQRPGEQERGADALASSRSTSVLATPAAQIATSFSPRHATRAPRPARGSPASPRRRGSAARCARPPRRRSAATRRGSAARRSCCRRGRPCPTAARRLE